MSCSKTNPTAVYTYINHYAEDRPVLDLNYF